MYIASTVAGALALALLLSLGCSKREDAPRSDTLTTSTAQSSVAGAASERNAPTVGAVVVGAPANGRSPGVVTLASGNLTVPGAATVKPNQVVVPGAATVTPDRVVVPGRASVTGNKVVVPGLGTIPRPED